MHRNICRHVHRHVCRHVYRHVFRHVFRHVYRHVYRHAHRHVYRRVYRFISARSAAISLAASSAALRAASFYAAVFLKLRCLLVGSTLFSLTSTLYSLSRPRALVPVGLPGWNQARMRALRRAASRHCVAWRCTTFPCVACL